MTSINIVIPSYNCLKWIDRTLGSVADQTRAPDRVIVIDDSSDEPGYHERVVDLCEPHWTWSWYRTEQRSYNPTTMRIGVEIAEELGAQPEDVIFTLDGDDYLPPHAVERIAQVYEDPNVWLTYGQYEPKPTNTGQTLAQAYPPIVLQNRLFRTHPCFFNHARTFRFFLWNELTDYEFTNDWGEPFTGGGDWVSMIPMLEMAGPTHIRFLNEVLYYYNSERSDILEGRPNIHRDAETQQINHRPIRAQLVR